MVVIFEAVKDDAAEAEELPPVEYEAEPQQSQIQQAPPPYVQWPRGDFLASGFGAAPGPLAPISTRRSAAEAQGDTANSVDAILASMSPGQLAALPEDTLDLIPISSLRKLSAEQKAILPEHILAKLSSGAYEQDQFLAALMRTMSVAQIDGLPWEGIVAGVSARTLNTMGPNQIGAIPWGRVFHRRLPPPLPFSSPHRGGSLQ